VTIWADGDSLQAEVRQLICRRANREAQSAAAQGGPARFKAVFVAVRMPPLDIGPGVEAMDLSKEANDSINSEALNIRAGEAKKPTEGLADDRIVELSLEGDLAVTRDLPLAERLADKGLRVLNDRGDVFTSENARERRSLRDRAAELRALGIAPPSPRGSTWGAKELKAFADAFDREIAKAK
jgi:uncharacterized protein YaiI (UPF0178 family)